MDSKKAVLRGKCIANQAYLKQQERSQLITLASYLKELGKEEHTKPKARIRDIIKTKKNKWYANKQTKIIAQRGNWVAQLFKLPTLDLGSAYDLMVVRSSTA